MKKLLILLFPIACYSQEDSTPIRQEVFEVTGKFGLVTTNGELYDKVVFGTSEEIERVKPIEFQKALARRKAIAFVTVKCK